MAKYYYSTFFLFALLFANPTWSQTIEEIESAQNAAGIQVDEKEKVKEYLKKLEDGKIEPKEVEFLNTIGKRVALGVEKPFVEKWVSNIVKKLTVDGDQKKVVINLEVTNEVNASIEFAKNPQVVNLTTGLLNSIESEDELAGIIAHELAHGNPAAHRKVPGHEDLDELIDGLGRQKDISPGQLEELRADYGAVLRMVRAGYNPWGFDDFFDRLGKIGARSKRKAFEAYLSTHPSHEVRMTQIKALILKLSERIPLKQLTPERTKLPISVKLLNLRRSVIEKIKKGLRNKPDSIIGFSAFATKLSAIGLAASDAVLAGSAGTKELISDKLGFHALDPVFNKYASIHKLIMDRIKEKFHSSETPDVDLMNKSDGIASEFYRYAADLIAEGTHFIANHPIETGLTGIAIATGITLTRKMMSNARMLRSRFYSRINDIAKMIRKKKLKGISPSLARLVLTETYTMLDNAESLEKNNFFVGRQAKKLRKTLDKIYLELAHMYIDEINLKKNSTEKEDLVKVKEYFHFLASMVSIKNSPKEELIKVTEQKLGIKHFSKGIGAAKKALSDLKSHSERAKKIAKHSREIQKISSKQSDLLWEIKEISEKEKISITDKQKVKQLKKELTKLEIQVRNRKEFSGFDNKNGLVTVDDYIETMRLNAILNDTELTKTSEGRKVLLDASLYSKKDQNQFAIPDYSRIFAIPDYSRIIDKDTAFYFIEDLLTGKIEFNSKHRSFIIELLDRFFPSESDSPKLYKKYLTLMDKIRSLPIDKKIYFFDVLRTLNHQRYRDTHFNELGEKIRKPKKTDNIPREIYYEIKNEAQNQVDKKYTSIKEMSTEIGKHHKDLKGRTIFYEKYNKVLENNIDLMKTKEDFITILSTKEFWPLDREPKNNTEAIARRILRNYLDKKNSRFLPGPTDVMFRKLLSKANSLGIQFETFDEKLELWSLISRLTPTAYSEDIFRELVEKANIQEIQKIHNRMIHQGKSRDWVSDNKNLMYFVEKYLQALPVYQDLLKSPKNGKRSALLKKVMNEISILMPKKGPEYNELLETISVKIQSTRAESRYIEELKGINRKESELDHAVRGVSGILEEALGWEQSNQWDLIKFLRGQIKITPFLEKKFEFIGEHRITRDYNQLKVEERALMLDAFLTGARGLLSNPGPNKEDNLQIAISLVLGEGDSATKSTTQEVLNSLFYALDKIKNPKLKTSIISFLLSQDKAEAGKKGATGRALKNVLEYFGATGIKLGQFLAVSKILPPEDTAIISELQSKAKPPEWEQIYLDLEKIFELKPTQEPPYEIIKVLGSASLKYAVLARDKKTGKQVVLKILRTDPESVPEWARGKIKEEDLRLGTIKTEFDLLDGMSEYLMKKSKKKYGLFRFLAETAKKAVHREIDFKDEVDKSKNAREQIYDDKSTHDMEVKAPVEEFVHQRLIVAELADGLSINDLSPADQQLYAQRILELDHSNLRENSKKIIYLNPDGHMGNFLGKPTDALAPGEKPKLSPIDFGQLLSMEKSKIEQVESLFALGEILRRFGPQKAFVKEIINVLGLDPKLYGKINQQLHEYFPNRVSDGDSAKINAYFTLLSALSEAGVEIGLEYPEYVRAVLQTEAPKDMVTDAQVVTSLTSFKEAVVAKAKKYGDTMKMSSVEKARFFSEILWETGRDMGLRNSCNVSNLIKKSLEKIKQLKQ